MEIYVARTRKEKKALLEFYKSQYKDHPLRRDSLSGLLKGVLLGTSIINESITSLPLFVKVDGKIIMSAVLAKANRMPDYLQISFFESLSYNQEAFSMINEKVEEMAYEWGCKKICSSLNIHVNYGLGFLNGNYDKDQTFGTAHNDEHIHTYFQEHNFKSILMVTFYKDMEQDFFLFNDKLKDRVTNRYRVRSADFKNMKEEAKIYTEINNDAFKDHPFYYKRVEEEDLELFNDFKLLLKPENLLFVEKDNVPVGFMLWYPDYHQVMDNRDSIGLSTLIKSKIFSKRMTRFKIVEMGVIKSEQKKGAILALFQHCFKLTKGKYKSFESGWVLEENFESGNFGLKWADGISKRFVAYEKELSND